MAWLAVVALVLLLALALLELGLWGSRGNLPALLAGQFVPRPRHIERSASLEACEARPAYEIQVIVDLSAPVAQVSPSYLSVALDLSQIVGGKWWDPRADRVEWGSGSVPVAPIDLTNPHLNQLAAALAPAYLRIGGSESDKVYYDLQSGPDERGSIPPGYQSVLTRYRWDAAHAFAQRNQLDLVFTLNAGPGSRSRDGRWTGENAAELMAYAARQGHRVAVWELGNELNIFYAVHGLGAQVPPRQYGEDLDTARALLDRHFSGARLAGQGSAFWPVLGEPLGLLFGYMPRYLRRAGHLVDVVTWHYYPQQSRRGPVASRRAYPSRLLDPHNLDEAAHWAAKIGDWRDRHAPGKPIWLGETGNAQFGGEPGLSDMYLAGLWWLDQLGLLARLGHQVMVRQTLVGMDYSLLDAETLAPRPDYWNSLLWKRLMGEQVYGVELTGSRRAWLRVYAHAAPSEKGRAVTVLAINLDDRREARLSFPGFASQPFERFEVNAPDVLGPEIRLSGEPLQVQADGTPPEMRAIRSQGPIAAATVRPLSYTFFLFPLYG